MHVGYRSVQTIKLVHFPGPAIEKKAPIVLLLFLEESSTPSCFIVDLIFVLLQAPFFSAWKLFTAYWIIINSCAVCAPVKVSLSRDETEKGGLRILTERKCTIKLISVGLTIPPDPPQKKHDWQKNSMLTFNVQSTEKVTQQEAWGGKQQLRHTVKNVGFTVLFMTHFLPRWKRTAAWWGLERVRGAKEEVGLGRCKGWIPDSRWSMLNVWGMGDGGGGGGNLWQLWVL